MKKTLSREMRRILFGSGQSHLPGYRTGRHHKTKTCDKRGHRITLVPIYYQPPKEFGYTGKQLRQFRRERGVGNVKQITGMKLHNE